MPKFSEIVADAAAKDDAVHVDQIQLATDQAAAGSAHGAVVTALKSKTPPKVDLPKADGTVDEITLSADEADFVVTNVAGDFEV